MKNLIIVGFSLALFGTVADAQSSPFDHFCVVLEGQLDAPSLASIGVSITDASRFLDNEVQSMDRSLSVSGIACRSARGCNGSPDQCQAQRQAETRDYARVFGSAVFILVVMTREGVVVLSPAQEAPRGYAELVINELRGGCSYGPQIFGGGVGYGFMPPLLLPRGGQRGLPAPVDVARGLKNLFEAFSPRLIYKGLREDKKQRHEEPRRR